ncbi:uncharacterized protein LOC124538673 [Vanessa cardui]|uniref:uncharacterized protein LOC124538673 n=1 Tax=Vanessa cardui TaxID=171605 RepID=UPI001F1350F3|nr:uncharacterized protein LOC124538673 [Vanessa cardui]
MPKRCRAVRKASCRRLVKNSDKVTPEPFKHFFENQTLSRSEVSLNLTRMALGRSGLDRPKRREVRILSEELHAQVGSSFLTASPCHQIAWITAPPEVEDSPMPLAQRIGMR